MNRRFAHTLVVDFEVRDLQASHRLNHERERVVDCLRIVRLPQLPAGVAQQPQNLGAVEPLPLAVIAEAHCSVAVLRNHLATLTTLSPVRRKHSDTDAGRRGDDVSMGKRILILALAFAFAVQAVLGAAQDGVTKQRAIGDLVLTASLTDRRDSFSLTLEVRNVGPTDIELRPEVITLRMIQPRVATLSFVEADALERRITRSADGTAAVIEGQGLVATTTVHEQVPVVEVAFNPASVLDPTQPGTLTTMRTDTVVRTVPDEGARLRSQGEAQATRHRASLQARHVNQSALRGGTLASQARVAGTVYFERDGHATSVLVQVPLGGVTVEIPFTARRSGGWRRALIFE